MTDNSHDTPTEHAAESPGHGRTDHDTMRAAAMRPTIGPASIDTLSALGGLELPGRESHVEFLPDSQAMPDMIPGERDATTLTHREPGAMGGQFSGAETPVPNTSWIDDTTIRDRRHEGGG